jgi:translation initiation factor 3 subunit L
VQAKSPNGFRVADSQFLLIMYHDNYEEDDLAAEVELVTSAQYTQDADVEDGFDAEGNLFNNVMLKKLFFFFLVTECQINAKLTNVGVISSQKQPIAVEIPDIIKNFITYFHRNVLENNVYELHTIYEVSFNKLTDRFYAKQPWPEAELISPLVDDGTFCLNLRPYEVAYCD